MRMVSSSGSILSCNTPILKGTLISLIFLCSRFPAAASRLLGRIAPRMLQALYELPKCAIQWRGHSQSVAAVGNRAVHEVHLRLALGKNVLQHAGLVLTRSVGPFLHQRAGIAVELDAQSLGDSLAFGNQSIEERAGGGESRGCAVMQQCESADRIGRGIEDQLGPLRTAGVLQRYDFQARAVQ